MLVSALVISVVMGLAAEPPAEGGTAAAAAVDASAAEQPSEIGAEERPTEGAEAAVVPPSLLAAPALVHPLPSDEAHALGPASVVVLITVGADGQVTDAAVVDKDSHPDPRLREAALAAAKEARFQPATRGGEPLVVRLPFELTFEPPLAPPLVDGVEVAATALAPGSADYDAGVPFDAATLGQSLLVGGALVLGASLLFTTFSGVTALDDATRQAELAKTDTETAAADKTRAFGTALLIPFAGPFLALPNTPDASTTLFTSLGGAAQVAGATVLVAGAALFAWPLFAGEAEPAAVVE